MTAYDFYKSLEHLTDNTDMNVPVVSFGFQPFNNHLLNFQPCYKAFLRVVRQYCHLLLMKWAGRDMSRIALLPLLRVNWL